MFLAATTSWPDAAIAIAGIAMITSVAVVVAWQAMATWRAKVGADAGQAYQQLAEQTARELRELNDRLAATEGE